MNFILHRYLDMCKMYYSHVLSASFRSNESQMIGKNLKFIIKTKGLKQIHVAAEAGISLSYLDQLLVDKKNPTVEVIRALARALEVNESDLIGDEKAAMIEQKIGDMTKS